MAASDRPDADEPIADTGTFKRFVEHEREMEQRDPTGAKRRWIAALAIILIIVIAVVVWLLTR